MGPQHSPSHVHVAGGRGQALLQLPFLPALGKKGQMPTGNCICPKAPGRTS